MYDARSRAPLPDGRGHDAFIVVSRRLRDYIGMMILATTLLSCTLLVANPQADEPAPRKDSVAQAIEDGVKLLLEMQEGDPRNPDGPRSEWPYEGVYRVRGIIPIGYRVGGSAIVCNALLAAPGIDEDEERKAAVARAAMFICASINDPLMGHKFESRYDVRGWGYAYGLDFLLNLKKQNLIAEDMTEKAETSIQFFLAGIEATEIPELGGWNYSRPRGFDEPSPHAPFMTGPTLLTLFKAKAMGYDVDGEMVQRGIAALEKSRTPTGAVMYSGVDGERSRESVPGSVGRMLVTEIALGAAGKSSPERLRGALDAFLVHWEWLDKRRAQNGTHIPPYNIAPYYFYYAHYYAAQAVELLPRQERDEYRRRVRDRIFSVRLESGSWNDRVFPRTANYGTAMCVLALLMPDLPAPTKWVAMNPQVKEESGE